MESIYEKLEIPEGDRLTSIRKEEAEFVYNFLKERKFRKTLETGFAYGCSTAYIIAATQNEHIAIDPYQDKYNNLGLKNIEKLGFTEYLRFIKELSHEALPKLLNEGVRVDFVFIDGGHKYDEIFIDWYYADLLLNQEGYIFFDDSWLPSTRMVAAFIDTNRMDYQRIETPIENLVAFQKVGKDDRGWDHFVDFGSNIVNDGRVAISKC